MPAARGFSLVEVMISVFILAIGLIMVITIFPVGGTWTRQATEATISQAVAQNALSIIQAHYPPSTTPVPGSNILQEFPYGTIRDEERCYQYGASTPCPADPTKATYHWRALYRKSASQLAGATAAYDVYILVFNKRSLDQRFGAASSPIPTIQQVPFNAGTYNYSTSMVTNAVPAVGDYGIGVESGTVFRQTLVMDSSPPSPPARPYSPTYGGGPVPKLKESAPGVYENVWVGDKAANNSISPLVYVYQTTLSWKSQ